jgi:CheY-like chemotaxis protein
MSPALLLADTEPHLLRHLRGDGFEIIADARRPPDVVIAEDGDALERWRGHAPVIVLGRAEADVIDRVRTFRRGCDDYKPSA